jgi:hypothetical protein
MFTLIKSNILLYSLFTLVIYFWEFVDRRYVLNIGTWQKSVIACNFGFVV